jgi:uncharacterized membrane protein
MCGLWGTSAGLWLAVVPLLLGLAGGLVALTLRTANRWEGRTPPDSSEHLLRRRYAAGHVSHQQYQDALMAMLQDRYIRGRLSLDAYERQVARVLAPLSANSAPPVV